MHSHPIMTYPDFTFTLTPATPSDIPTLAQISQLAFATDTHTRLKALIKGSDHALEMSSVVSSWLSRPKRKCTVMKAVTPEGETVGWAFWAFAGFEYGSGVGNVEQDAQDEGPQQKEEVRKVEEQEKKEGKGSPEKEKTKIEELGAITGGSMREWKAKLMPPGSKCMILVAIPVLPAYQGMGVGSALIRWGTRIADEEGVYCWCILRTRGGLHFRRWGLGRWDG